MKFIRCDNAGEHQSKLQDFCKGRGIILEYTAPNTPKQNGRVEKKINGIWIRLLTMMVNANLKKETQGLFWAEAVKCSNDLEDLYRKSDKNTLMTLMAVAAREVNLSDIRLFTQTGMFTRKIFDAIGLEKLNNDIFLA